MSELAPGTCFKQGKTIKKKLSDGRVVSVSPKGKVRIVSPKSDPVVASISCDLKMLGTGLRKHPELMVEMGSGRPTHIKIQKLK